LHLTASSSYHNSTLIKQLRSYYSPMAQQFYHQTS